MSLAKVKPIPKARFRIKDGRETKPSIPGGGGTAINLPKERTVCRETSLCGNLSCETEMGTLG